MDRLIEIFPILFINIASLCLFLVLFRFAYRTFYWPAKMNSYRFKLFSIRDDLNLLVLENKIDCDSIEYEYFIDFLNFYIRSLSDYSILSFVNASLTLSKSRKLEDRIKEFHRAIKREPEITKLYLDAIHVLCKVLLESSFLLRQLYKLYSLFVRQLNAIDNVKDLITKLTPPSERGNTYCRI